MLAVLKTGAAYLPIDPALPAARIGFVLADAAPDRRDHHRRVADRLDGWDLAVIDVNDPAVASQPSTALPAPAPDDIAYLIYTSGTTGVPKGVAVTHRNVTQLAGVRCPPDLPAAGRCGRSGIPGVRLFGVGDLGRAVARGAAGGGARGRGAAHRKTCTPCWSPNRSRVLTQTPSAAADAVAAGAGVGGVAARRGGLPGRAGGPVGARAGDDQRLRPHRGHGVRVDECAADSRVGCGADRLAGAGRGVVRARQVVAAGAGRGGR